MANHGWVDTRRIMTPEAVQDVLDDLNKRLLFGNLKTERSDTAWLLTYHSDGKEWVRRSAWLEPNKNGNLRHFEIRHGGGSDFAWWIDTLVLNEIAVVFNGKIGDDGVGNKWVGVPHKYDQYSSYLNFLHSHIKSRDLREKLLALGSEYVPSEFKGK